MDVKRVQGIYLYVTYLRRKLKCSVLHGTKWSIPTVILQENTYA